VRNRLNRLIKEEYIQVIAVSNPVKLEFGIVGILKINVDSKKIDNVTEELNKIPEIWYIVHVTGESDIYAEFNTKSIDDLNNLIT